MAHVALPQRPRQALAPTSHEFPPTWAARTDRGPKLQPIQSTRPGETAKLVGLSGTCYVTFCRNQMRLTFAAIATN